MDNLKAKYKNLTIHLAQVCHIHTSDKKANKVIGIIRLTRA